MSPSQYPRLGSADAQPESKKIKRTRNINSMMHHDKVYSKPHGSDVHQTNTDRSSASTPPHELPANRFVSSSESEIFSDASRIYHDAAGASRESLVRSVHEELQARLACLNYDGHVTDGHGVPSQADFEARFAEFQRLALPINDTQLNVGFQQADGSIITETIAFGDTWRKFEQQCKPGLEELAALEDEIGALQAEMTELVEDTWGGGNEAINEAIRQRDIELSQLKDELESAEAQLQKDKEKIAEEEKTATKAFNQKFRECFGLLDDH